MTEPLITSPTGVLTVLSGVCAFFFFLEEKTKSKLFNYLPPLVFIYAIPVILSNTNIMVKKGEVYDWFGSIVLPMFLVIMLLRVDIAATVKIMGRGIFVMLFGSLGVIAGAVISFLIVKNKLPEDSWKAFGMLTGSWIGGTGNMAAVSQGLKADSREFAMAVVGDNLVYIIWLPILLGSKSFAGFFNRFTRVDKKRIEMLEKVPPSAKKTEQIKMRHFLYLFMMGFCCVWIADFLSVRLPVYDPILSASTWKILIITTLGLFLSMTPARNIPASHELAMALLYLFVANMGAKADISGLNLSACWFLLACYIWIVIHGLFCVFGAYLLKVDIHSTAIASAANIGGAASAPVVASSHNEKLVPVSILMALIGYAIGNYGGFLSAAICFWLK